jgi:hypothetical protein
MKKQLHLLLFFLITATPLLSQNSVKIQIKDAQYNSPVGFAKVQIVAGQKGGISDINGELEMTLKKGDCFEFFQIGFEKTQQCWQGENPWLVQMPNQDNQLHVLKITPTEDPAYRVIRKAIAMADENNIQRNKAYQYEQYSKMVAKIKEGISSRIDSLKGANDLFISECVSEYHHAPVDKQFEKIILNKVSGFPIPQFTILGSQFQSFNAYEPDFEILENVYLSPLGPRSIDRYQYKMEDTLIDGLDSTFVISFKPLPRFEDNGMLGVLHIKSPAYALTRLTAEPAIHGDDFFIKIQQDFSLNDQWYFPTDINAFITYLITSTDQDQKKQEKIPIALELKTHISKLQILEKSNHNFDAIVLDYGSEATAVNQDMWDSHRPIPLSKRDSLTYFFIDSLSASQQLSSKVDFIQELVEGKIRHKKFSWEIDKLLRYNGYEGYRMGLGGMTNTSFHPQLSVGGYYAYGSKDHGHKASAKVKWVSRDLKLEISGAYIFDVIESGQHALPDYRPNFGASSYAFFVTKMDHYQGWNGHIEMPLLNTIRVLMDFNDFNKTTYSEYRQLSNGAAWGGDYHLSEIRTTIRWAPGEKRQRILNKEKILGGYWPVFRLAKTQGNCYLEQYYPFTRYQFLIDKTFHSAYFGEFTLKVETGTTIGTLPWSELQSARGSLSNRNINITIPQTFQTMTNNRYYARDYAQVMAKYEWKTPLYRREQSKPRLAYTCNAGWGRLGNNDQLPASKVFDYPLGYYEAGIHILDLYSKDLNRLGFSTYYRFGPYHDPNEKNNWLIKLTSSILF